MRDFIQMLLGGIIAAVPSLLLKIGIGVAAYKGIDTVVGAVKDDALSRIAGLQTMDPVILQLAGVLQIGTGINILCSAVIVRFTIQGLTAAGGIKRFTPK